MYPTVRIVAYSHACRAPKPPPLLSSITAAAIRMPTSTAIYAKNSVVLKAALVSVLSRRARCGAVRAPSVLRLWPVRTLIGVLPGLRRVLGFLGLSAKRRE